MQKAWSGHAVQTHLTSPIATGDLVFAVAAVIGWPSSTNPFVVTVDAGTPYEEKILCASFSGTTVTVFPGVGRGWDGTTAQAHGVGVDGQVVHSLDADTINFLDAFAHSIGTSAPHTSNPGDTVVNGTTGIPADAGHVHAREQFGTSASSSAPGDTANGGYAATVSRSDHKHAREPAALPRVGEVVMFAGSTLPATALWCDGATYSNSAYPALAAALGTTWGGTPGTSFAVPDMRSRVPVGSNQNGGSPATLGAGLTARTRAAFWGHETVTLSSSQIPALSGTAAAQAITSTDSGHAHQAGGGLQFIIGLGPESNSVGGASGSTGVTFTNYTTTNSANITSTASPSSVTIPNGSQGSVDMTQPSLAIGFIVYTA